MEAVLERSLPTLTRGDNITSLNTAEAMSAIEFLYSQAAEVVDWAVDVGHLRVTRLDLNRDFTGVADPSPLLYNLARLPVRRASAVRLHLSEVGAVGLERATRSRTWRAILYDKDAQTRDLRAHARPGDPRRNLSSLAAAKAAGRVRFEAQLRSDILRRKGITTVRDLDDQPLLEAIGEEFFQRARFDATVGGPSRVEHLQRALAESGDPAYKYFGQVLGMLHADALGLSPPVKSPMTLAKYRDLARTWGLTTADVFAATSDSSMALDYHHGRVNVA